MKLNPSEPTSPQKVRLPENSVVDEIYTVDKKNIGILVLLVFGTLLLAFLFNFPFSGGIKPLIAERINKNRACPITYQSLDIGYFLPKIILDHPTISGNCFKSPGKNISFDEAYFQITMPSFWPIGLKTKFHASSDDATLNIFPRIAFGGHAIQIEDTTIKGSFLNQFSPLPNLLKGDIKVQANLDIKREQIETGNIILKSKNLHIHTQNISGFNLPTIALRNLDVAGTITKKKVHLKAIRLGDKDSPLQAEFKGSIVLSSQNISFSSLNLQGKFRIDDSILNTIGLLRIMLNGKKKKDNFYFLQLKGTLARPQPVFIDPV